MTSYHDLHITTPTLPRTSIFNLPYRVIVQCTRAGGWEVWARKEDGGSGELAEELLGAEYGGEEKPLRLDVAGHVIVDSMGAGK